jgi:hypothetical protein
MIRKSKTQRKTEKELDRGYTGFSWQFNSRRSQQKSETTQTVSLLYALRQLRTGRRRRRRKKKEEEEFVLCDVHATSSSRIGL